MAPVVFGDGSGPSDTSMVPNVDRNQLTEGEAVNPSNYDTPAALASEAPESALSAFAYDTVVEAQSTEAQSDGAQNAGPQSAGTQNALAQNSAAQLALGISPRKFTFYYNDDNIYSYDPRAFVQKNVQDLETIVALLKTNSDYRVRITGHVNPTAQSDNLLQSLSARRAQDFADILIANGIRADRMTVTGAGAQFPVAGPTETKLSYLNSRLECTIMR
jgi:outer membrane protein OmpA-like peptidoglycan-associated protein